MARTCALIEAECKVPDSFKNQPRGYVKRLKTVRSPSVILFVTPAQQLDSLWPEL